MTGGGLLPCLHENEIPDLEYIGVVRVDQRRSVSPADAIKVQLGAGAAGSHIPHLAMRCEATNNKEFRDKLIGSNNTGRHIIG